MKPAAGLVANKTPTHEAVARGEGCEQQLFLHVKNLTIKKYLTI